MDESKINKGRSNHDYSSLGEEILNGMTLRDFKEKYPNGNEKTYYANRRKVLETDKNIMHSQDIDTARRSIAKALEDCKLDPENPDSVMTYGYLVELLNACEFAEKSRQSTEDIEDSRKTRQEVYRQLKAIADKILEIIEDLNPQRDEDHLKLLIKSYKAIKPMLAKG